MREGLIRSYRWRLQIRFELRHSAAQLGRTFSLFGKRAVPRENDSTCSCGSSTVHVVDLVTGTSRTLVRVVLEIADSQLRPFVGWTHGTTDLRICAEVTAQSSKRVCRVATSSLMGSGPQPLSRLRLHAGRTILHRRWLQDMNNWEINCSCVPTLYPGPGMAGSASPVGWPVQLADLQGYTTIFGH